MNNDNKCIFSAGMPRIPDNYKEYIGFDTYGSGLIPVCIIWGRKEFLSICFQSEGCFFRKRGYCSVCNYGSGRGISSKEAIEALRTAFKFWPFQVNELLLGSFGSILDEKEISEDVFDCILKYLMTEVSVKEIIFETHYSFITQEKIQQIGCLKDNANYLTFEMGLETINESLLKNCLNKCINLDQMASVMNNIQQSGMYSVLNIMYGLPGLRVSDRERDVLNSLEWAFYHGASSVVLFPTNIKPGTKLYDWYRAGEYARPLHREFIELLMKIPDKYIEKISVSWYGERQYRGIQKECIEPDAGKVDYEKLMKMYGDFNDCHSRTEKRRLLKEFYTQNYRCG